jgi:GNAT superfamily N-acetyltransferase
MTYTTIRGATKHSAKHQQHIDRAVDMLHKHPGLWGSFDEEALRGSLTHPSNVLIVSNEAVAVLCELGTDTAGQIPQLKMLCVEEESRGRGLGGKLLQHIISAYTTEHVIELESPPTRENFYKRHGFHTLVTKEAEFPWMVGPGETRADVLDRLPEGHILQDMTLDPLESFPWACPVCAEISGPTVEKCADCGYTKII